MSLQPLTLNVPAPLYDRLKQQAEQNQRSVEAEMLDVLAAHLPVIDQLPADLASALSPLTLMTDEELWRAARSRLGTEAAAELEQLHLKQQRETLSQAEMETEAGLVRQYERAMLVRAHAAALLHQRGHNVDVLP